jgi:ankyrin repeat protein
MDQQALAFEEAAKNRDMATLRSLLEAGVGVVPESERDGPSAIRAGQYIGLLAAAIVGDADVTRLLLRAGANPNVPDEFGQTALFYAACKRHIGVVEELLKGKAKVDGWNVDGWTALMWAAENGHVEVVSRLIAAGAPLDHQDQWGQTALMRAAHNGYANVVSILIGSGADVSLVDQGQQTARDRAVGFPEVVQVFEDAEVPTRHM